MLRAVLVLVMAGGAFNAFVIWMMRSLRRSITEESDLDSGTSSTLETLPLHLYNTVIQQLKQQKHELQVQTLSEQRRAAHYGKFQPRPCSPIFPRECWCSGSMGS